METGAVIDEVGDGYAKVHCAVTEMHLNARGVVMGGVLFTLADFAFAVAANCGSQEVVSLQDQISYLSPVKGGVLWCVTEMVSKAQLDKAAAIIREVCAVCS
jgi:acyl-CoA thioesterase